MRIISSGEFNAAVTGQKSSIAIFDGLIGRDSYLTIRRIVDAKDRDMVLAEYKMLSEPAASAASAFAQGGTMTYFTFADPYSITAFLIQQLRTVELAAGAPA